MRKRTTERFVLYMEEQQKIVEEVDEGELLVLGKALSGLKGAKEKRTENIFHSRCTA